MAQIDKEALRALRESRKDIVASVTQRVRENKKCRKALTEALAGGPKTVPELALETGIRSELVLWLLTGMKKYGKVAEGEQTGSYFRYVLLKE